MKKKFYIVALLSLFFSAFVFSQTNTERKMITENYNANTIESLKSLLKEKSVERENKISSYLASHKGLKRKLKVNSKSYIIYNIVDGKPIYRSTHNINSAKGTKTDKLHLNGGLGLNIEGENMSIGVWDVESALESHDEFKDNQTIPQTRVVYPEFNGNPFIGTTSNHATHVAGTLIAKGNNSMAKGMAPKAQLRSFDWNDDDTEALTEAANGLLISNHSYGTPIFNSGGTQQIAAQNIGAYTSNARVWDQIAFSTPYYLAVNSAGNEGTEVYAGGLGTGFDKLTGNKTAKNNLVVANANPFLLTNGFILRINPSSSQGPTDDFRIKPDISGDGTDVFSSTDGNDSDYSTFSGTSMASPNVAGSLLLLQEYYNQLNSSFMRAATLKGLVCHTAIDDNAKVGPDAIYGWGFLDTEKAANTIKNDNDGLAVISELNLSNGETYTFSFNASAGDKLQATICWTDPAGTISSSPNNILSPRLVNDLDLRIENQNALVFTPWKLDNTNVTAAAIKGDNVVDNIERVDIDNPISGSYTITVSHKGILENGSQAFSLILTGTDLTLSTVNVSNNEFKIWPNPVSEILNIGFFNENRNDKIKIYNIQGKQISDKNFSIDKTQTGYKMNVSRLQSGLYFIKISNDYLVQTHKILVNNN